MLTETASGFRLAVHATPGARRTVVGGSHDDALRVSVNMPADKGKANKAVQSALAEALGVSRSQIELIRGATHRRKVFLIIDPPDGFQQQVASLAQVESDPNAE